MPGSWVKELLGTAAEGTAAWLPLSSAPALPPPYPTTLLPIAGQPLNPHGFPSLPSNVTVWLLSRTWIVSLGSRSH